MNLEKGKIITLMNYEMKKVEDFWTYDYYNSAKDILANKRKLASSAAGGSPILESPNCSCATGTTD